MFTTILHANGRGGRIRRWFIERRIRKLKLDADQAQRLDELRTCIESTGRDVIHSCHEPREIIGMLPVETGVDREDVHRLIRDVADRLSEQAHRLADRFAAFYDALEPWQREQLRNGLRAGGRGRVHRCR